MTTTLRFVLEMGPAAPADDPDPCRARVQTRHEREVQSAALVPGLPRCPRALVLAPPEPRS